MNHTGRVEVLPQALAPGALTPPPSKSDAQRALILANLAGRPLEQVVDAREPLPSDVRVVLSGLAALRTAAAEEVEIDCRDGGAPFRLLLTQAALTPSATVRFVGTRRLWERPHGALFHALEEALGPSGLTLTHEGGWPLRLRAPARIGDVAFRVSAHESSQHVSSLLLGACAAVARDGRPASVTVDGELASAGYLDMTVGWARRCGFAVEQSERALEVKGFEAPGIWPQVPGDWSSLGYLLVIAWASGGTVRRVDLEALHPDKAVVRILDEVGVHLEQAEGGFRVVGRPSGGIRASGSECPDLLPTLAAFACVCPAPSHLSGVGILRHKESDRLEGICALIAAAGGRAEVSGEDLHIHPPARVQPFSFSSRGDHRMAMSAATLAVIAGVPLQLEGPDCVDKSFPDFFGQLQQAGVRLRTSAG